MAIKKVNLPNMPAKEVKREDTGIDFTKKWGRSDVALLTQNAETLLYTNKNLLAIYSPFFEELFFSEAAKTDQETVKIDIKFEIMLDILKILHHVGRNFGKTEGVVYSVTQLADLYGAAVVFDIPIIRHICKEQFIKIHTVEALEMTIELGLYDEKSEIIKLMAPDLIETYLKKEDKNIVLTPMDAHIIIKKDKNNCLPKEPSKNKEKEISDIEKFKNNDTAIPVDLEKFSHFSFHTPNIFRETADIDFTKPWKRSDIVLQTKNSEQLLYANKNILATFSSFFDALFFSGFAESEQEIVKIDIKFVVMLEILKILHQSERNFVNMANKVYSSFALIDLYKAGDKFEIPLILKLFKQQFALLSPRTAFEVAIETGLHDKKLEALKLMSYPDIDAYLKKGINELVLSPMDVAVMLLKSRKKPETLLTGSHIRIPRR